MRYVLENPLIAGGLTITVVSRLVTGGRPVGRQGVSFVCAKEPTYILFENGPRRTAMDMNGSEVGLDLVRAQCPELAAQGCL